jgi:hypothetical protein
MLQCKEPYISPYVSPATGYLVIEGYISGNTPTSFTLSRTIKLSADTTNPQELGANVQVEGNDNSVYPLIGQGGGVYTTGAAVLFLNTSVKYRVRVQTQSGGQYLSDYTPYKITPVIDSINWIENSNGVTIYANAHDDGGSTRYYQWNYDETWEYHSAEESGFEYQASDTSVVYRPPQDEIYRCWQGDASTNILIASSDKQAKDVIYEQPMVQIPQNSVELVVLYSILVRQYALTDSAYNYLSLIEKNTESLGTIFDPQPSELYGGNIRCLTNSNEPVIGFVCAGTVQQQRIFIDRLQLSNWYYAFTCANGDSTFASKQAFLKNFATGDYIPLENPLGGYTANRAYCVDCTYQGGTTNKPPFWPY